MIKRLVYIALLLIFASGLSSAKISTNAIGLVNGHAAQFILQQQLPKDSLNAKKRQQEEDRKKIKEVLKAKRQSKPEKIGEGDKVQDQKTTAKPKRERRPEGLERPPEIPRRNGN